MPLELQLLTIKRKCEREKLHERKWERKEESQDAAIVGDMCVTSRLKLCCILFSDCKIMKMPLIG